LLLPISARICEHAERILGEKDPPSVVLDEIIAIPICFLGIFAFMEFAGPSQPTLTAILEIPNWGAWALATFALFRLFDIWKPGPIDTIQKLPNGWGVIMDDILAGAVVCIILTVAFYLI
jgi:phosphatidylglycerophosphatase A